MGLGLAFVLISVLGEHYYALPVVSKVSRFAGIKIIGFSFGSLLKSKELMDFCLYQYRYKSPSFPNNHRYLAKFSKLTISGNAPQLKSATNLRYSVANNEGWRCANTFISESMTYFLGQTNPNIGLNYTFTHLKCN